MCGRTALTTSPEALREIFGLDELPQLSPHFNVPPSQPVAVVRTAGHLEWLRWGLVPFWAKDPKMGHKLALARVETVQTTPAFREAIRRRRCLVVVSGFYEWQRVSKKTSTPFFIHRADQAPFAVAGVWERWISPDGEVVESCAVVTTVARPPVDAVHGRMPLVLARGEWAGWLDRTRSEIDISALLVSQGENLTAFAVGPHVNDPRHDDAECVRRASAPRQEVLAFDTRSS